MKDIDNQLIALLKANARESISALARKLNVTRATVQDHLNMLERRQIIKGYTLVLGSGYDAQRVSAQVMIAAEANQAPMICDRLKRFDELQSLYTISGQYDLVAQISCTSTEALDQVIDEIADIAGVQRTQSSILLSDKLR